MNRTFAVVKREFSECTRSKVFLLGTLFGPVFIIGLFAFQILMFRNIGGDKRIAIVDGTPQHVSTQLAIALNAVAAQMGGSGPRNNYKSQIIYLPGRNPAALRTELDTRILNDELHGYIWLRENTLDGDSVRYEGKNATVPQDMAQMQLAVQAAVQSARLGAAGIDLSRIAPAMQPVPFAARKTGKGSVRGDAGAIFAFAYFIGYLTLLVIFIYGAAVQRGVLEEKKDRIVEVVTSSIRAEQLMMGKVVGIGGASLLQVLVWAVVAAAAFKWANPLLLRFGAQPISFPDVPASVAALAVIFFAGGYFLYSSLYAAFGALATTDQEGQQLMMPVVLILMASYFVSFRAMNAPDSPLAVAASLIPFSSPLIVPIRAMMTHVPLVEMLASLVLLFGTGLGFVWLGGKIYRIGILATGKKPSMREVVRWLRTASY